MDIEYRVLHTNEEFDEAVELEVQVWGLDLRDAIPTNIMRAASHDGGGVVLGAYDSGRLVGMSFGFPARRENQWVLWSHMTGVHPDYQGSGVGFGLKQLQRTWALEFGYNVISWTFDPMQRGNANFNLHRLGVISAIFHVNLYGEMTDAINAGLQSDRFEATWILRDRRVAALAEGVEPLPLVDAFPPDRFLLWSEDHKPVINPAPVMDASWHFVEIPYDIQQLKKNDLSLAIAWQLALREVVQRAFANRWVILDFIIQDDRCWYVLRGTPPQAET